MASSSSSSPSFPGVVLSSTMLLEPIQCRKQESGSKVSSLPILFGREEEWKLLHNAYRRSSVRLKRPNHSAELLTMTATITDDPNILESSNQNSHCDYTTKKANDKGRSAREGTKSPSSSSSSASTSFDDDGHHQQEFVLIRGASGTGKTALANSLRVKVEENGGFFLTGKFDVTTRQDPYAVFVSAMNQFAETFMMRLCQHDCNENVQLQEDRLRTVLQDAVGAEGRVLTAIIPSLAQVIGMPHDDEQDVCHVHGATAVRRFQLVFAKLCRAMATIVPVVLFLDDLQWSDQASLDLLQVILMEPSGSESSCADDSLSSSHANLSSSSSSSSLLVIGAYRNDNDGHLPGAAAAVAALASSSGEPHDNGRTFPFSNYLQKHWLGKSTTTKTLVRLTQIPLFNLTETAVNEMVAATLHLCPKSTAALAQVVHAKSNGNAFHALQCLRLLSHQQPQQHHRHHCHPSDNHNEESVVEECDEGIPVRHHHVMLKQQQQGQAVEVAETANGLVGRILQTLPPFTLELIKLSSFIRDEIDPTVLALVLDGDESTSYCDIAKALDFAVEEGLLAFTPEQGRYRFIHDRIRQAAVALVDNADVLSLQIGRRLCQGLSPISLRAYVYTVVNLLNKGIEFITDLPERYKVAELNLEAGLGAVSMAAFPDAAEYFGVGIAVLLRNSRSWDEKYQLMLDLYNGAADAELCNQRFDRVQQLTSEVFQKAKCFRDKIPSYITQINATGQSGKVHAAMELGFDVLRQLGEPFPSHATSFVILTDILKTKVMIRGRSNEKLLAIQPMVDQDKLAAMHIMNVLITYAVQAASPQLVLLGTRMVQVCLKHGLCKTSSVGFNTYGWVLCRFDRKQGYRFGNLALSIIEKFRARELIPRVHSVFYFWNCHWIRPLKETLKPLRHACTVGMDIGDTEYGLHAAMFRCFHSFHCGLPLPQVSEMFVDTMNKLRHFKMDIFVGGVNARFQLVRALMGSSHQNGVVVSTSDILHRFANDEPSNKLIALQHYSTGATLAYLWEDCELAEKLVGKRLALKFDLFAEYSYALDQFQHGLIAIARARSGIHKTGNEKIARKVVKMMAVWAKDCPFNFLNKEKLLLAELRSLQSEKHVSPKTHQLYGEAFQLATEQGCIQEAALSCELAGDFMHRHGERHLANTYWDKSHALYLEWGATAKASQLQSRLAKLGRAVSTTDEETAESFFEKE